MDTINFETKELKISTSFGHLAVKGWNEKGKKTPILAFHGWMDNAGTWDKLCPLLDEEHPFYALDFAGHGFSSHLPLGLGTFFMNHLVSIDIVVRHFKWKKVILMGHSMGGAAGLMYSGTRPDLVEKVIAVDALRTAVTEAKTQPIRTANSLDQLNKVTERFKTKPPRYRYEEMVEKLVQSYTDNLTEEAARTLLIRNSQRHEDGTYAFTHSPLLKVAGTLSICYEQQDAFFANITCDILFIKAISSPVYGVKKRAIEALNSFKKTSKNFEFEVIEGTHHVHLINPLPVAEIINRFLHGEPQTEESKSKSQDFIRSKL